MRVVNNFFKHHVRNATHMQIQRFFTQTSGFLLSACQMDTSKAICHLIESKPQGRRERTFMSRKGRSRFLYRRGPTKNNRWPEVRKGSRDFLLWQHLYPWLLVSFPRRLITRLCDGVWAWRRLTTSCVTTRFFYKIYYFNRAILLSLAYTFQTHITKTNACHYKVTLNNENKTCRTSRTHQYILHSFIHHSSAVLNLRPPSIFLPW